MSIFTKLYLKAVLGVIVAGGAIALGVPALAGCAPSDIHLSNVQTVLTDGSIHIAGVMKNVCADATDVQMRVFLFDSNGDFGASTFWPTNAGGPVAPGSIQMFFWDGSRGIDSWVKAGAVSVMSVSPP